MGYCLPRLEPKEWRSCGCLFLTRPWMENPATGFAHKKVRVDKMLQDINTFQLRFSLPCIHFYSRMSRFYNTLAFFFFFLPLLPEVCKAIFIHTFTCNHAHCWLVFLFQKTRKTMSAFPHYLVGWPYLHYEHICREFLSLVGLSELSSVSLSLFVGCLV